MSEFDSRIGRDSSESEDRSSRSDRVVHTSGESWDTIRPALSVPNQCPPQMIEIQISCKMCQIRIKVLMEHFRSFCNQPNIHQMCQGIHFKRHRGRGWVQKGHLVLHLHNRTLGTSCAFPCIGIGIGISISIYIYRYMIYVQYKYIHTHIQTRACTQPACSEIWRPGRPQPLPGFELPFGKNGQENPVGATDGTSENFPGITLVFFVNYILYNSFLHIRLQNNKSTVTVQCTINAVKHNQL